MDILWLLYPSFKAGFPESDQRELQCCCEEQNKRAANTKISSDTKHQKQVRCINQIRHERNMSSFLLLLDDLLSGFLIK